MSPRLALAVDMTDHTVHFIKILLHFRCLGVQEGIRLYSMTLTRRTDVQKPTKTNADLSTSPSLPGIIIPQLQFVGSK